MWIIQAFFWKSVFGHTIALMFILPSSLSTVSLKKRSLVSAQT